MSAARCREPGVLPWARRSCALPEEADPCNRTSVVPPDQRALRLAPGIRDRPQSVSPACLAPKMGRSCTKSIGKRKICLSFKGKCVYFYNTVVLGVSAIMRKRARNAVGVSAEHRKTARSFAWSAIASGSALSVCSVCWQRRSAGRFHPLDACAACGGTITESGVVRTKRPRRDRFSMVMRFGRHGSVTRPRALSYR